MNKEIRGERIDKNIRISEFAEAKIDGAAGNGGASVSSVSVIGGAAKKIEGGETRSTRDTDDAYSRGETMGRREGWRGSVWERDGTRRRENNARTRRNARRPQGSFSGRRDGKIFLFAFALS